MRTQGKVTCLMLSLIYSVVYIFLNVVHINVEFFCLTVDRLRRFFRSGLMIVAMKKNFLKENSEVEMLLTGEDSERLRSTGY